jgi:hypothetical protein
MENAHPKPHTLIYNNNSSTPTHNWLQKNLSSNHTILQKIWKGKTIPPLLRTFDWHLFRHALATTEQAGRYATNIDKYCTVCGLIENDYHLFFLCDLPQQVWVVADVSPFTHHTDPTADGIQPILPYLFPSNSNDQTTTKTLLLLWYIWKALNDQRFQRKTWTSFSVQHATTTHFQSNLSAWGDNSASMQHQPSMLSSTTPPQGFRCYFDVAITPDITGGAPRLAGLGIFIVSTYITPLFSLFVKASL